MERDSRFGVDQLMGADVPVKIGYLAIDTVDPKGLAPFWCGLFGVHVDTTIGEGEFLFLKGRFQLRDFNRFTSNLNKATGPVFAEAKDCYAVPI